MKVITPEDRLRSAELPALTQVSIDEFRTLDCLVLCAGFEERSVKSLADLMARGRKATRVVIVDYLPVVPENRLKEAVTMAEAVAREIVTLTYDRLNPSGFGDRLMANLQGIEGALWIDLSGMSRLMIVQVIVALLLASARKSSASLIYTAAEKYSPLRSEAESLLRDAADPRGISLLSSGVYEVTILPELSSRGFSSQQICFVTFPSFDADQLYACLTEIQTSRIIAVIGNPPYAENAWRRDFLRRLIGAEELSKMTLLEASTLDYRDSLNLLLEVYRERRYGEKVVVCPTGSKMQSVAVGILRAFLQDVQICYPTPMKFNRPKEYSVGTERSLALRLDYFRELYHTQFCELDDALS